MDQEEPRGKFNLSQFYAREPKQSIQAIQARNHGVLGSDAELSATAVSSGGETPQTILPKREPLLSEDDTTDTEHLRNELAGDEEAGENAQSE